MAWEGSTRKATLPAGWDKLRLSIFERDGWQCTHTRSDSGRRCSEKRRDRLECDHVNDRDDHSPANLTTLCRWHHIRKSSSQGGQATVVGPKPTLKRRPPEAHPGLIQKR